MRLVTAAVGTFISVLGTTLHAQDLEPRAYSNSPVGLNFVIAGYGYGSGTVLTDPALPLENVSNESHVGVLGFATTFGAFGQTGQFGLIVPYASIAAKGLVFGLPHTRNVDGFADTAFRFSMNFVGAPALTAAEFKNYHQDFIFGMSLRVTAPLSQYDGDKLVNIGTNRWSFKPEIGFSKAFGPWTAEFAPGVTFYTDNRGFFGGKTREVAPLFAAQSGLSYTFAPGGWAALNVGYFKGARTTVDEVESDVEQEGIRFGATLVLPVNRYQSVKLYSISGYNTHSEHDFQAFGIAWQYRWGGGY
jgi:Putative MetA-pathway of phenol degradation